MNKTLILILLLAAWGTGSGCSPLEARKAQLDASQGRAYETARFTQIVNPDAGKSLEPIEGVDGTAALNTLDKYQKGFRKEESVTRVFNINVE